MERTFAMIKPDGVKKGLIGEIISRFERRGLIVEELRLDHLKSDIAKTHYSEHRDRDFFVDLVDYVTSGPVVLMMVAGIEGTVDVVRQMIGATDPAQAAPGTIRGDFAVEISKNIIHGSDSVASAKRELKLFFPQASVKAGDGYAS